MSLAMAETPSDVSDPREVSVWISDSARLVDDEAERNLNRGLERIHDQTGSESLVVTVGSAEPSGEAFAETLLERWGLSGKPGLRAAVVVIAADQKVVTTAVSPAWQGVFDTSWREGVADRLTRGLENSLVAMELDALVSEAEGRIRRSELGHTEEVLPEELPVEAPRPIEKSTPVWAFVAGGVGLFAVAGVGGWVWSRRRKCPRCAVKMEVAPSDPEQADLGYRVDACGACGYARFVELRPTSCPECKKPSMKRAFRLEKEPVDGQSGEVEITESCEGCGFERSTSHPTPASAEYRAD